MEEILGRELISSGGLVQTSDLAPRFLLFYFSAHWCGPCKKFTPQLSLFYESCNSSSKQVEIVYISKDKSEDQFSKYFRTMPWLAVPFDNKDLRKNLSRQYSVSSIPTLILLNSTGEVKSRTCRNDVIEKGPLCLEEWDRL